LASLAPAPTTLHTLLTTNDPDTNEPFVKSIRAYNSLFAFTSLGTTKVDKELADGRGGAYTFRLHGAMYHAIGGLMPKDDYHEPTFAQIYFYDTDLDKQLQRRTNILSGLNSTMIEMLQNELHLINPFVKSFTSAGNAKTDNMELIIHNTHGKDMRQYNQPTASEVAAIFDIDLNQTPKPRDIVLKTREGTLKHISELNGAYDPLHYPLLFPRGEYGWHDQIFRAGEIEPEDEPEPEPEPEAGPSEPRRPDQRPVDPMNIDEEGARIRPEDPMEIDDEGEYSERPGHTGMSQDLSNMMIALGGTMVDLGEQPRTKKDKGKGKAKEVVESDNEFELASGNEDLPEDSPKIQPKTKKRKRVTIREFAVYMIQIRDSNKTSSIIHLSGRLFQQYLVDQYAKWESNNLRWHRENQVNLRSEFYAGLHDIVMDEDTTLHEKVGKKIILSSTFTGSTRYMQQLYQDSMAIVREFGKPDLFVTVTCNPTWPEIADELLPNQRPDDRPDLVARVFKQKLKSITEDLFDKAVLGKVLAHVHVIEFQKRGLPHAHILMILDPEDKPKTPEDFDRLVCAEIPDENDQPKLFETVSKRMVHGPCGVFNPESPCMVDGKCSKKYH